METGTACRGSGILPSLGDWPQSRSLCSWSRAADRVLVVARAAGNLASGSPRLVLWVSEALELLCPVCSKAWLIFLGPGDDNGFCLLNSGCHLTKAAAETCWRCFIGAAFAEFAGRIHLCWL